MSSGPIALSSVSATRMDHPTSPNRGPHSVLINDGHSPSSPPGPPNHLGMEAMGYRPAQPGPGSYGGPPPPQGYPTYPPPGHGGPSHSPYISAGPPPSHAYPRGPPNGYPGAYPPSHQSPTSYPPGYPYHPGAPRPPYYGFEGGYPGQQPRLSSPFQSPLGSQRQGVPSSQEAASVVQQSQHHGSPSKPSPQGSPDDIKSSSPSRSPDSSTMRAPPTKHTENVEVERLRAAAATELTQEEVRPIETDFHFFVKDNLEKYRKLAEEEMKETSNGDTLDPYLVNSNLNSRILKAWEILVSETRDTYMQKEEEDRRRFMEEDEIASRHCATLTARGKSPRDAEKDKKSEEIQEIDTKLEPSPNRDSPTTPSRMAGEESNSNTIDTTNIEKVKIEVSESVQVDSAVKKGPAPSPSKIAEEEGETQESPMKRSRLVED